MADMQTTYGGGQSRTVTSGLGSAGGAGMLFDPSMLGGLLRRRLKEREEDRRFELEQRNRFKRQQEAADLPDIRGRATIPEIGQPAGPALGAAKTGPMIGSDKTAADVQMETAERRARMAELQAASGPAPTRITGQAGGMIGRTLDPNAMNAYQRQMYLPKQSGVIVPPSERSPEEELDEFDEFNARAARRAAVRNLSAQGGLDLGARQPQRQRGY